MNEKQALEFVKKHGAVFLSARGPLPNLADKIAGEPVAGQWKNHSEAFHLHRLSGFVQSSEDVLTCRLPGNKITYLHKRLWPALVKCAVWFPAGSLDSLREEAMENGEKKLTLTPFPKWVPASIKESAIRLNKEGAEKLLQDVMGDAFPKE